MVSQLNKVQPHFPHIAATNPQIKDYTLPRRTGEKQEVRSFFVPHKNLCKMGNFDTF